MDFVHVLKNAFPENVASMFDVDGMEGGKYVYGEFTNTDVNSYNQKLSEESMKTAVSNLTTKNRNSLNFNHDPNKNIGKILDAKFQDGKGYILAKIDENNPEAVKVYEQVENGYVQGMSPTFMPNRMSYGEVDGKDVTNIDVGEFIEVSLTQQPVNKNTSAYVFKNSFAGGIMGVENVKSNNTFIKETVFEGFQTMAVKPDNVQTNKVKDTMPKSDYEDKPKKAEADNKEVEKKEKKWNRKRTLLKLIPLMKNLTRYLTLSTGLTKRLTRLARGLKRLKRTRLKWKL